MNNQEKLVTAFTQSLGIPMSAVVDTLSFGEGPWDSIAHMVLVTAIETAHDIMLDTEEILDMSSFAKAKEIVQRHGIDFHA